MKLATLLFAPFSFILFNNYDLRSSSLGKTVSLYFEQIRDAYLSTIKFMPVLLMYYLKFPHVLILYTEGSGEEGRWFWVEWRSDCSSGFSDLDLSKNEFDCFTGSRLFTPKRVFVVVLDPVFFGFFNFFKFFPSIISDLSAFSSFAETSVSRA